jgi:hypothetical protein
MPTWREDVARRENFFLGGLPRVIHPDKISNAVQAKAPERTCTFESRPPRATFPPDLCGGSWAAHPHPDLRARWAAPREFSHHGRAGERATPHPGRRPDRFDAGRSHGVAAFARHDVSVSAIDSLSERPGRARRFGGRLGPLPWVQFQHVEFPQAFPRRPTRGRLRIPAPVLVWVVDPGQGSHSSVQSHVSTLPATPSFADGRLLSLRVPNATSGSSAGLKSAPISAPWS